jgi:hypothetical protein
MSKRVNSAVYVSPCLPAGLRWAQEGGEENVGSLEMCLPYFRSAYEQLYFLVSIIFFFATVQLVREEESIPQKQSSVQRWPVPGC